jgi:hypothetical protein
LRWPGFSQASCDKPINPWTTQAHVCRLRHSHIGQSQLYFDPPRDTRLQMCEIRRRQGHFEGTVRTSAKREMDRRAVVGVCRGTREPLMSKLKAGGLNGLPTVCIRAIKTGWFTASHHFPLLRSSFDASSAACSSHTSTPQLIGNVHDTCVSRSVYAIY